MARDPDVTRSVRASDADRERMVRALRAGYADGRLDHDELERRVQRAYEARTRADLRRIVADLPRRDRVARPSRRGLKRAHRIAVGAHVAGYTTVNGAAIGTWMLLGEGAFWPAIVVVPTTMGLAAHAIGVPWAARRVRRRIARRRR